MTKLTIAPPAARDAAPGADAITYGAVHLGVVDVGRSLAFWRDRVGLTELARSADDVELGAGGRALIVLHGGAVRPQLRGHAGLYHVALHLPSERELARAIAWQGPGATQPPPGTAGLRRFELVVRDDPALSGVRGRLERAGVEHDVDGDRLTTHDPAGNALSVGVPAGA
jgi:catechol-2,3-dioxygenase